MAAAAGLLLTAPVLVPTPVPAAAPAALVEQGRRLAAQYQCGACHRLPGVPAARGTRGPSLEHFAQRSYIAGTLPNATATLQRWIVAPAELLPGTTMPALGVAAADARAIAAFLQQAE